MQPFFFFFCCLMILSCQNERKPDLEQAKPQNSNFRIQRKKDVLFLTVYDNNRNGQIKNCYALYPKKSIKPLFGKDTLAIAVPIERAVCLGTNAIAFLAELESTDKIVGLCQPQYIYNATIREKVKKGTIANLNTVDNFDYELMIKKKPDIIFGYSLGCESLGKKAKKLNIPIVYLDEFLAKTPLDRAEWLVFTSLFVDKYTIAKQDFESIKKNYLALVQICKHLPTSKKPKVLTGTIQQGIWYVAGGASYSSQMIQDAGAIYPWQRNNQTGSIPLSLESVIQEASDADFWINTVLVQDAQSLEKDNRYRFFRKLIQNNLYTYTARVSPEGAFDYYESGIVRPDLILKDLIRIFHPELLPEHKLYYYKKLTSS